MKNLIRFVKTKALFIVSIPIIINFFVNLIENKNYKYLLSIESFIKITSILLGSLFIYSVSITIKKTFKLNSYSLSITYFFLSFFIIDTLFLPLTKLVSFDLTVSLIMFLWLFLIIYLKKGVKEIIQPTLTYLLWRIFNFIFISDLSNLSNYNELNTDVPVQWYKITKMIYENNYFYSLENNLIEGQGLLPSYLQSLFLKIGFDTGNFIFIQTNANLLLFLGFLLIFDLKISRNEKIILSVLFIFFILNNDWLSYLLINSLMIEGIVSFLIAVFLINFVEHLNSTDNSSAIYFLFFGSLVLTKNFVSILSLIIIFSGLLWINKNNKVVFGGIVYVFYLVYQRIYFSKFQNFAYTDEINFGDLFLDLLLLRNLEIDNIRNIFSQIYIDKPLTYLIFCFVLSNVIGFIFYKNYNLQEFMLFFFVLINYFLVNLLYISYWQNIEYESSYRYIVSCFHLILISTGIQLSNFKKNIKF